MDDHGIRGALEDARTLARSERAAHFADTDDERFYLVPTAGGPTLQAYPHRTPDRTIDVATIESFMRYLEVFAQTPEPHVPAYVSIREVRADLSYAERAVKHSLHLSLVHSEPYTALHSTGEFIAQEDMHHLLANPLREHVDRALLLQVATLKALTTNAREVSISPVGLKTAKKFDQVRVEWMGKDGAQQAEEMQLDWVYEGPLFSCWTETVRIPVRLQFRMSGDGLRMRLARQDAQSIIDAYLVKFRAHLESQCKVPNVHFLVTS